MKTFRFALIPLAIAATFFGGFAHAQDSSTPPASDSAAPAASAPASSDSTPAPADSSSAPASSDSSSSASAPSSDASSGSAPAASGDSGSPASSDTSSSSSSSDSSSSSSSSSSDSSAAPPFDFSDDRRVYLAPMFTYTLADKARGTDNGLGGTVSLGKRVTHGLELELVGFFSDYHTKQDDFSTPQSKSMRLYGGGLGANLYLAPSMLPGLFMHLDVMRGQANGQPGPSTAAHYGTTMFDAGLGYDLPLHFTLGGLIDYPSLRFEALYRQDSNNQGSIGTNTNGDQHYFTEAAFNVGLRIPFGSVAQPAVEPAPPPPVQVVPEAPAPAAPPPPAPPPCQPPAPGQPISLEGCKTGDVIVLHGVNFEFNKATLTLNAKTLLDQVGDALLARKDIKVEIDGHTDGKGGVAYNQKLSERRADSVKAYLVTRGVDEGRMSTKGFGKSMPIATNDTDEGREANRRVELKVTESNGGGVESAPPEGAADSGSAAAPAPAADSGSAAAPAPADSGSSAAPADAGTPPASGDDTPASQSGPPGEAPPSGAAPQ